MMNAIEFLKHEHQTAKAAFAKVLEASPEKRGELWKKLTPELKAHEQMEDAGLYQPLSRDAATKDSRLAGWRQQHQAEVEKVEPVMLPPGRARPWTRPVATASPVIATTIGMLLVDSLAARLAGEPG